MKTDLELVKEVQQGSKRAFSDLVIRHQPALLRLCVRFTKNINLAEDVVQEAFVKAYKNMTKFEGRAAFKSWLFQIAVNTAKNKLRSQRNETVDLEKVSIPVAPQAQTDLENIDLKKLIQKHIDVLPMKQRTALVLRVFEDLSFKEIAKIMDCPYDTAKANYRHALMKLRKQFSIDNSLRDWNMNTSTGGYDETIREAGP